jgi:hypothetical protein
MPANNPLSHYRKYMDHDGDHAMRFDRLSARNTRALSLSKGLPDSTGSARVDM